MVYHGPSQGCRACRKRRVKCDQGKPDCNNCVRRKVECPGYESTFDYRHRNQTDSTILRAQRKKDASYCKSDMLDLYNADNIATVFLPDETDVAVKSYVSTPSSIATVDSPPIFNVLDPDPETLVLNWYFAQYPLKNIDPQSSHGFISLLKPFYLTSSIDSPLRPAVAAVASNLLMLFCHQGSDTLLARRFYAQSVSRMQQIIGDPIRSRHDDLMLTTLALNFYDTLNLRWSPDVTNYSNHRDGAIALLKHRGTFNHASEASKHLTISMRTALCYWALEEGSGISADVLQWLEDSNLPTNKACELDIITFKIIAFQKRFNTLYRRARGDTTQLDQSEMQSMIDEGLSIDDMFTDWINSFPNHWKPLYASAEAVVPSIKKAGMYGRRCAVYWDLSICDAVNTGRSRRLKLLHMVRQLCVDSKSEDANATLASIESQMQTMIDEQCEAVPFMIGDVDKPMIHAELYDITYPSASNGICEYPNVDQDHPRAAAASGGWFATALLVGIVKLAVKDGLLEPFPLRKSQFEWIYGQLGRMQKVFLLSQPVHRDSWRNNKKF